jgi:tetratricopeptide (TPR) repeat protein
MIAPVRPPAKYTPDGLRVAGTCLMLFLGTLAVFGRAVGNDFANFDDFQYVTRNAHVQDGLGWAGMRWALISGEAANWHPLTWLSHMADWTLFGSDPRGHHAVSVGWHALNAVLVFCVLRRLTGNHWASAFCAALFAWHPLRVESVAWVAERKDVLSGFFGLVALWAYANYAGASPEKRASARRYYGLALAAFALGLMCKPMLVTLPGVFLLVDFWPLSRGFAPAPRNGREGGGAALLPSRPSPAGIWTEKIPFFFLSAVSCVVTFLVQRNGGAVTQSLTLDARLANAMVAVPRYLGKLLFPFDLAVVYPYAGNWPSGAIAGSALLIAAVTFAGWRQRRRRPWLLVGWLWFLGMLVPVSGVVQVGVQSMGDRYTYLPMLGVQIAAIWSVNEFMVSRGARTIGAIAAAAILAGTAFRTWDQIGVWKNSFTLFDHAIAVTEGNYTAYNNRGVFLEEHGRIQDAEADYRRALEIDPDYGEANTNFGHLLYTRGRAAESLPYLRRAIAIRPGLIPAHVDLGAALSGTGLVDEAIEEFKWVLAHDPENVSALNNYGVALEMKGRLAEAQDQIVAALRLKPRDADALRNLGNVQARMGRFDEAIADYRRSLALNPGAAETYYNLGTAFRKRGDLAEAAKQYERAIELRPINPMAHEILGLVFAQLGRREEAIVQLETAIQQKPDFSDAKAWLQKLLASPVSTGR